MKKFLLFLISILSFSFLLVNNKTNAQVTPTFLLNANYSYIDFVQENTNTFEYDVHYFINGYPYTSVDVNNYYLFSIYGVPFRRGLDRRTNSYTLDSASPGGQENTILIIIRVTVLKTLVNDEYSGNPVTLFSNDTMFYVSFDGQTLYDTGFDEGYNNGYDIGYNEGYNNGYNTGTNDGYTSGYNVGYNDGLEVSYDVGYQAGYLVGYDDGKNDWQIIGYYEGYEEGYDTGYNDGINASQPEVYQRGYEDGLNSAIGKFTSNFHIWIIPAIIIVFAIGIFIAYKRGRE